MTSADLWWMSLGELLAVNYSPPAREPEGIESVGKKKDVWEDDPPVFTI